MANGQIEKFTPLILLLIALVAKTPFPSSIPGLLIWPFFSSTSHFTLKMEAAQPSETLVYLPCNYTVSWSRRLRHKGFIQLALMYNTDWNSNLQILILNIYTLLLLLD